LEGHSCCAQQLYIHAAAGHKKCSSGEPLCYWFCSPSLSTIETELSATPAITSDPSSAVDTTAERDVIHWDLDKSEK